MARIRLLVVEDNRLLREGITAMLNEQPDFRVVASLGAGENLIQKIRAMKLNIVLLDLGLRSHSSLAIIQSLRKKYPDLKIIVMDLVPTESDILECVKAGVSGFVLKDATIREVFRTIRSVAHGGNVLPTLLTGSLFTQIIEHAVSGKTSAKVIEAVRMTRRERQVIELIADGMSNKEIAHKLHLSTYTVKSHVHNILEKLAMHTRVQIATYAHDADTMKSASDSVSFIEQ